MIKITIHISLKCFFHTKCHTKWVTDNPSTNLLLSSFNSLSLYLSLSHLLPPLNPPLSFIAIKFFPRSPSALVPVPIPLIPDDSHLSLSLCYFPLCSFRHVVSLSIMRACRSLLSPSHLSLAITRSPNPSPSALSPPP
jgi:hypothetical protein